MAVEYYDIDINKGTDASVTITLKDSSGNAISLTNSTAKMQIRPNLNSDNIIDTLTTGNGRITGLSTDGNITLSFPHVVTSEYPSIDLIYDLILISSLGVYTKVIEGKISVKDTVTDMTGYTTSTSTSTTGNDIYSRIEVKSTGSTVYRTLGDRFADVINVKDFGAKGDGTTDDTAAIQAVLTSGKIAFFPAGTYAVSSTLVVGTSSGLIGEDERSVTIKLMAGSDCPVIRSANYEYCFNNGGENIEAQPLMPTGFVIKNLTVDGNRTENYTTSGVSTQHDGAGIAIYGRGFTVESVLVRNCAGIGFRSVSRTTVLHDLNDVGSQYNTYINHVRVFDCDYEGFVFEGVGDIKIDDILVGKIGDRNQSVSHAVGTSLAFPSYSIDGLVIASYADGTSSLTSNGTCEVGFIHSYSCWAGRCVRISGPLRINADNIHAEGGYGCFLVDGNVWGHIQSLSTRNNVCCTSETARPQVDLSHTRMLSFGNIHCFRYVNEQSLAREAININCHDTSIAGITVTGDDIPADGVVINKRCYIGKLYTSGAYGTYGSRKAAGLVINADTEGTVIDYLRVATCSTAIYYNGNDYPIPVIKSGYILRHNSGIDNELLVFASNTQRNMVKDWKFTVQNSTTLLYPNCMKSITVPAQTTTDTTFSVAHGMWRTPNINEIILTPLRNQPATFRVVSADSTNINIKATNTYASVDCQVNVIVD